VVTAAELLSVAAFTDGKWAQAFPSFGSERTGAPVVSFCRISDTPIRTRAPVTAPDALIVQDPTLVHQLDLFGGLEPDGFILVNWVGDLDALKAESTFDRLPPGHVRAVPATELALRHVGLPVPNTALLGAFAALTGVVSLSSVLTTVRARFEHAVAEANVSAAAEAYQLVAPIPEAIGASAD
jgi:pyruvate ferredoxin oxidoreductase gamma subunit